MQCATAIWIFFCWLMCTIYKCIEKIAVDAWWARLNMDDCDCEYCVCVNVYLCVSLSLSRVSVCWMTAKLHFEYIAMIVILFHVCADSTSTHNECYSFEIHFVVNALSINANDNRSNNIIHMRILCWCMPTHTTSAHMIPFSTDAVAHCTHTQTHSERIYQNKNGIKVKTPPNISSKCSTSHAMPCNLTVHCELKWALLRAFSFCCIYLHIKIVAHDL